MIPIVLTVAGSDPSGGAGIQADIKTISALGGYAASVITAITAQNTLGVQAVYPTSAEAVTAQLNSVFSDLEVKAVKIGMLPNVECIQAIASALKNNPKKPFVVCDPVMISTSGRRLMEKKAVEVLQQELFPLCTLITPNLHEASFLSGQSIEHLDEMDQHSRQLSEKYDTSVLIKGGHLSGTIMCDVLYEQPSQQLHRNISHKIESSNLHGTGCTLSSAIATYLAKGQQLQAAVLQAKDYIEKAILHGKDLEIGHGNGPLCHFFE